MDRAPERFYEVHSGEHVFPVRLHKLDVGWRISFGGGKGIWCTMITVYAPPDNHDIAVLDGISYRSTCAVAGDMQMGVGTIHMMRCALNMLHVLFPGVRFVDLKDTATITCAKKVTIPLLSSSFAKYGKSWYERHFAAKRRDGYGVQHALERGNAYMRQKPATVLSFEDFFRDHVMSPSDRDVRVKDYEATMRHGYDAAETFYAYFKLLSDCIMLDPWLPAFLEAGAVFGVAAKQGTWWRLDVTAQQVPDDFRVKVLDTDPLPNWHHETQRGGACDSSEDDGDDIPAFFPYGDVPASTLPKHIRDTM